MDVTKIRPLRDEVLIKKHSLSLYETSSVLYIPEDRQNDINCFEVISVGSQCTLLKVGDIIGIPFNQHTLPIDIDGEKYAAVSEKDVWLVVEI